MKTEGTSVSSSVSVVLSLSVKSQQSNNKVNLNIQTVESRVIKTRFKEHKTRTIANLYFEESYLRTQEITNGNPG